MRRYKKMLWRDASSDHEGNTDEKQLTESRSGKRRGASRDRTHGRKEPRMRLTDGALPGRQPRREEWQRGSAERKRGSRLFPLPLIILPRPGTGPVCLLLQRVAGLIHPAADVAVGGVLREPLRVLPGSFVAGEASGAFCRSRPRSWSAWCRREARSSR